MEAQPDDAALVRDICERRDADAEAELCRRLVPRVRAYGLRHLRDRAAAADFAQHVVVAVLEAVRAGRVEQPERLAAFVMGTCRNTLLDWRAGERRRGALLEKFGPTFASSVEAAPMTFDRARLADCFSRLAPREQTIVALTYYAECDGPEVAREVVMSLGALRVARHRALRQLRDCLTGGAS